jgi:hypothetical protein
MTTEGVTGRDGLIVAEALACYIAVQDALPQMHQSRSNMLDAVQLFAQEGSHLSSVLLATARRHIAILKGELPEGREVTPAALMAANEQARTRLEELQEEDASR